MTNLKADIKRLIIEALDLEDVSPQDIADEAPLFGESLGLDSIDALELGLQIQKKFQVKLDPESQDNKRHFHSVNSLAEFIASQATPN